MPWLKDTLDRLAAAKAWGYHRDQPSATEPTAFAALALLVHGHIDEAHRPLAWLVERQLPDGSLGVSAEQDSPGWPTSLAILAWCKADQLAGKSHYRTHIDRAIAWTLGMSGKPLDRVDDMGHDTTLIGWPWVDGTHSWLEPTAFAVLALKAAGYHDHLRTREAVQLIINRLLPEGGCNYGNTAVLGQLLRPHVQPSGMALVAICDEHDPSGRVARTIEYLQTTLLETTTSISLSFALLGLGAAKALPKSADARLESVARQTLKREASPYQLALLALAAKASRNQTVITIEGEE